jgi:hypothetical protein
MDKDIVMLENLVIGSARGRKAKAFFAQPVRELNMGDLQVLLNPPTLGVETNVVKKMRNTHHMLARLLAEGRAPGECALVTGYSPSRISILQHDPAFQELLGYYKSQAEAKYLDVHERLATLGMAALDELQERLEEKPEDFSNGALLKLATDMMDRSVTKPNAAPPTSGVSLSVTFVESPHAQAEAISSTKPGLVIEGTKAP